MATFWRKKTAISLAEIALTTKGWADMSSHKGGTNATKDVIYIDVDDEITGIIDKVGSSEKKIVALVLPKRATVLQSVVNMKLLKRAATDSKKNLVLITSEHGLMPLAGSVGVHVAKSLNSKPEVPDAPAQATDKVEEVDEDGGEPVDKQKTLGELSGTTTADEDDETIELDDEDGQDGQEAGVGNGKSKKNRKFKIPNFNKFRLLLVLGGVGVILLSMAGYAAVAVWPRAKIIIKTDSEAVNVSVVLTLKTGADTKLDVGQAIIPTQIQEVKKTIEQQVPATGQLNNGEKATGSVNMTVKDCPPLGSSNPNDVAAGTGISSGGKTYITQEKAEFSFSGTPGGCVEYKANNIDIFAQGGGAQYNVSSANFTVAGRSDVTATGSAGGGTDNIVKIVSQADVDSAKQKITEQDTQPILQELKTALIGRDLFALDATMSVGTPETKLSAEVKAQAETLTVSQTINYAMYGVKQDDLEKIIGKSAEKSIDTKKQIIIDYGLDKAVFGIQSLNPDGALVSAQTTVVAGAELDEAAIKKQVAGKKAGAAKEILSANPGVTDVSVEYSPFWVSSIPKKTGKITVIIQEPRVVTEDDAKSP